LKNIDNPSQKFESWVFSREGRGGTAGTKKERLTMRIARFCAILLTATLFCLAGAAEAQGQGKSEKRIGQIVSRSTETNDTEEYSARIIIEGKWGTGPGEFGHLLIQAPGEVPEGQTLPKIIIGPDCLFVDNEGNIYVLDQINKRVQKFSSGGAFLKAIPIAFPEDVIFNDIKNFPRMYIDNDAFIYIQYSVAPFSWFVFDQNGNFIKRFVNKSSLNRTIDPLKNLSTLNAIQKRRRTVFESIAADTKTIVSESIEDKYDDNGDIYIDNMRMKRSRVERITPDEMKAKNVVTALQRTGVFLSKAKKTTFEPKNEKAVTLIDVARGEQYVSSSGEVYKIIRSRDSMSPIKVIKWQKKK
jgi:hypothetical protein